MTFRILILLAALIFTKNICFGADKSIEVYDKIIKHNTESNNQYENFLPNLNNILYEGWEKNGEGKISNNEQLDYLKNIPAEILNESAPVEIFTQGYKKDNHQAEITIFRFIDTNIAYSFFTFFRDEKESSLKLGQAASEYKNNLIFWKGNYVVYCHSLIELDLPSKEFSILASQDLSKNIDKISSLPDILIYLPSLYKIPSSEKFCKTKGCITYILNGVQDIDTSLINSQEINEIIKAKYLPKNTNKNIIVFLSEYKNHNEPKNILTNIKNYYLNNPKQDITVDEINPGNENLVILNKKNKNTTLVKSSNKILAILPCDLEIDICKNLIKLIP